MLRVKVPASTANMGAGFDCMGLALNLYNELSVYPADRFSVEIKGQGSGLLPSNVNNLSWQAMQRVFQQAGEMEPAVRLVQTNHIPMARGLGSSAAAIVSGIMAANALVNKPLSQQTLLDIAVELEGHPDNVAPCLLGGMVASLPTKEKVLYSRVKPSRHFKFAVAIPSYPLSTQKAREALPSVYPKADAVGNIARAVLMYAGLLEGNAELIHAGCQDAIHQPYRKALVEGWDEVNAAAYESGAAGVFLSGAGPSIMTVYPAEASGYIAAFQKALQGIPGNWRGRALECDGHGARVIK